MKKHYQNFLRNLKIEQGLSCVYELQIRTIFKASDGYEVVGVFSAFAFINLETKHWEAFSGIETGSISVQFEPKFDLLFLTKQKSTSLFFPPSINVSLISLLVDGLKQVRRLEECYVLS